MESFEIVISFSVMVPHLHNLSFFLPIFIQSAMERETQSLYFEVKLRTPIFPQEGCVYVLLELL